VGLLGSQGTGAPVAMSDPHIFEAVVVVFPGSVAVQQPPSCCATHGLVMFLSTSHMSLVEDWATCTFSRTLSKPVPSAAKESLIGSKVVGTFAVVKLGASDF